ncbi:MAG: hypothetical protein J6M53_01240 [Bacteroidaceae bacterium]|nr:hypothetical protein [Bacteroidaceae bacterium]
MNTALTDIRRLAARFLDGQSTPDEEARLAALLHDYDGTDADLLALRDALGWLDAGMPLPAGTDEAESPKQPARRSRLRPLVPALLSAAAAAVLAFLLWPKGTQPAVQQPAPAPNVASATPPAPAVVPAVPVAPPLSSIVRPKRPAPAAPALSSIARASGPAAEKAAAPTVLPDSSLLALEQETYALLATAPDIQDALTDSLVTPFLARGVVGGYAVRAVEEEDCLRLALYEIDEAAFARVEQLRAQYVLPFARTADYDNNN